MYKNLKDSFSSALSNAHSVIIKGRAGFTLVELLVVIALIGILAAIALVVINPTQMQNRAKDGVLKAQLDKIGMAASALVATDEGQTFPTCANLTGSLNNVSVACAGTGPYTFSMTVGNVGATVFTYGGAGTTTGCLSTPAKTPGNPWKWCSTTGQITQAVACTSAGC